MEIRFQALYHPKVVRYDIPLLPKTWSGQVRRAIEEKLLTKPETFGKPLRESLRGYRKLCVGDYRIVFRVEQNTVYIIAILHRSIVYRDVQKRDE